MDYRHTRSGVSAKEGPQAGGFTLIEMVVAIVVLGVLTSLVAVNWASFMRHQELRQDALSLHKEILALKARAIEQNDTAKFESGGSGAVITWRVDEEGEGVTVAWPKKPVTFNKDVAISANVSGVDGLPSLSANEWTPQGPGGKIEILAMPDNINAYANGRIVISSASAKGAFCIQKDDGNIKPEIYYRSKEGGTWSKM
ncbi:MAG: type II secretion system GspH family protein [Chitinispirillales bacterium]|jgi:prepilin-type N-terminal cleavage/methylation domain-containing protein|nr:type II secretion system GspH family protein [Chitinispirillales bacterium]